MNGYGIYIYIHIYIYDSQHDFTAFGKPAGHREVAPREFDVHSRWLTVYQMSSALSRAVCMSLWLDSCPLHGRKQGQSGESLPQGRLMPEREAEDKKKKEKKKKRRKKKERRRQGVDQNQLE